MRRGDWKRYAVGLLIAAMWGIGAGLAGKGDYEDALIRDAIRKDAPMAHPLSCPIKDESGRPLRATISGRPHDLCYYGPAHETGGKSKSGSEHKRRSRALEPDRNLEKP